METANRDERNRLIANKEWAWSGYLLDLITDVAALALRIAGENVLSMAASGALCLMLVLYWVCYLILSKKY